MPRVAKGISKEQRRKNAAAALRARWDSKTPAERSAYASKIATIQADRRRAKAAAERDGVSK